MLLASSATTGSATRSRQFHSTGTPRAPTAPCVQASTLLASTRSLADWPARGLGHARAHLGSRAGARRGNRARGADLVHSPSVFRYRRRWCWPRWAAAMVQPIRTSPLTTWTAISGSGEGGGPCRTCPVRASNTPPWHGQTNCAAFWSNWTGQPAWVQVAEKAVKVPPEGWTSQPGLPSAGLVKETA